MSDLSPAGLAAKDAAYALPIGSGLRSRIAAALRATADQVVPEDFDYWDNSCGDYASGCETGQNERNAHVRRELLAIAAELDGTNPQVKELITTESNFRALCAELEGLLIKLREMVLADARFLLDEDSGAGIYGVELDVSIDESLTRARAELANPYGACGAGIQSS
jgi:hypothetical protein